MVSTNGAKPQHHAKKGYAILFKAQKKALKDSSEIRSDKNVA